MASHLAGMALRSALFADEDSVEADRDCLQEELNRFEMKNEQTKNLIMEKYAAMRFTFTCLLDMKKKVAIFETEKGLLAKANA